MSKRLNIQSYIKQNIRTARDDNGRPTWSKTKEIYTQQCNQFLSYLSDNGKPKNMNTDRMLKEAQGYITYMHDKGYAGHSIHTAISALAKALHVKMEQVGESQRTISTKGRNGTGMRTKYNERICEFASKVGIRREEYANLTGKDLIERNGNLYVVVRKGKGGKYQEQLIAKENEEYVKSVFQGVKQNDKVFTEKEIKGLHNANVHALRRANAQEMYRHYASLKGEDREALKDQIQERFKQNPKKMEKFDREKMDRPYYTKNRELTKDLKKNGFGHELDRLALMAVAVFHLSHYREGVVVQNYLR